LPWFAKKRAREHGASCEANIFVVMKSRLNPLDLHLHA
jgi:hypothetical protein